MIRRALVAGGVAWLALSGPAASAGGPRCQVTGKLQDGPDLSRSAICQAVLEGVGRAANGTVSITIRFEPPATATARLVTDGIARPPVSIAISDRALRRKDLVELGRTIAELMRSY